jgi:hypothetical protein
MALKLPGGGRYVGSVLQVRGSTPDTKRLAS